MGPGEGHVGPREGCTGHACCSKAYEAKKSTTPLGTTRHTFYTTTSVVKQMAVRRTVLLWGANWVDYKSRTEELECSKKPGAEICACIAGMQRAYLHQPTELVELDYVGSLSAQKDFMLGSATGVDETTRKLNMMFSGGYCRQETRKVLE